MSISRTRSLVALLGLAILGNGCDEPTGPPALGAILVEVDEEGTDVPQLGYLSSVDNGTPRALAPSLRAVFPDIEPGAHSVRLEGLAPNCAVLGQNPMTVQVASNQNAIARFNVSCVAHVGTVRVTTVTTGGDQDPNGYLALVDGAPRDPIGVNAVAAISAVRVGLHAISLGDVAPNCTVAAPHPVDVNVVFQGTVEARFDIQCVAAGTLQVTVATTGVDLDPNGYRIGVQAASVGFTGSLPVTPNGSVAFASLSPATDYRVMLQDLAANCDAVGADVQTTTVTAGSTTSITFDVACVPPPLLAFERDGDIYVIASNGTGATRLTTDPAFDGDPAWSSIGRIAFTTRRHNTDAELYVMNADGTNAVRLTTSAGEDAAPSWSPNGGKIVFQSSRDLNSEIYVVNADGTGLTRLTNNTAPDHHPAWLSTGKIAFVSNRDHPAGEIYVMNEDGSNVVRITNNTEEESSPAWSPDGSMIAFSRAVNCIYYYYGYECGRDLFVMNADGSNARRLATGEGNLRNADPAWSPSGHTIAFTQAYCPYYCDPPSVRVVDLHGSTPTLVTNNAANPAWKP